MVTQHQPLIGNESEQTQEIVKDRGAWLAVDQWSCKESDMT